eukprot:6463003-Amphidinium_carterae.3
MLRSCHLGDPNCQSAEPDACWTSSGYALLTAELMHVQVLRFVRLSGGLNIQSYPAAGRAIGILVQVLCSSLRCITFHPWLAALGIEQFGARA